MKTLITFLLLLYSININAQHFYISAGGGYNLPVMKQDIGTYKSGTNKVANVVGSYGKGVTIDGSIGYNFNKHISAEIILSKLDIADNIFPEESDFTINGTMTRIIPTIKFSTGNRVKAFLRSGFIVGINPHLKVHQDVMMSPVDGFIVTTEYTDGNSFGFYNAVGVEYMITNALSVSIDFNTIIQNWGPEKSERTVEIKGRATPFVPSPGTTSYSDEMEIFPGNLLKTYYPFNSMGLHLGIVYHFQKKEKKEE